MAQLLGLYEKALPSHLTWEERLSRAAQAGYEFVEISIDESESRLERLGYSPKQRAAFRDAIAASGVPILTMCLSGHRRYPLGSASPAIRRRALDIFENAIEFAFDIGIRIIQVAGYDVYYEPRDAGSCARYADGLHQGADWASQAGIMLGLENVDSENLDSLVKGMEFVHGINSPWLHLYPDIGNLVAMGYDPVSEIEVAVGHLVGVHIKDTILGQVRRIPFGGGIVPFAECFRKLNAINFCGPMVIEMWCDERPDAFDTVVQARRWIEDIQEHARPGG